MSSAIAYQMGLELKTRNEIFINAMIVLVEKQKEK